MAASAQRTESTRVATGVLSHAFRDNFLLPFCDVSANITISLVPVPGSLGADAISVDPVKGDGGKQSVVVLVTTAPVGAIIQPIQVGLW